MDNQKNILNEINEYSILDLKLIINTQRDLYTAEEMAVIEERLAFLEQEERKEIEKLFPKEIVCEKCDAANPFSNEVCEFCGHKFNKEKYYDPEYYENQDDSDEDSSSRSNAFRYIASFLVPLIGYILGAILLSKDDSSERSAGTVCIILSLVSTLIPIFFYFALFY